jgi:hypothetical protein
MQLDPMTTMHTCYGDSCERVPDEVVAAVNASLQQVPVGADHNHTRDTRAATIAPRMVEEGWRFCPCYAMSRTEQHARIFELVHTNMANRLAHKAAQERAA